MISLSNYEWSSSLSVISFYPRKDSYITEYNGNRNFGGTPYLFANRFKGPQDVYRTLIQFDFNSLGYNQILPGSNIISAQLQLYLHRNELPSGIDLDVHMIKQNWHEFTVNWNNQPIFSENAVAQVRVGPGYHGMVVIDITDLAKWWYEGTYVNQGLLLKGTEEMDGVLGFYSREHLDSTLWPRLTVNYLRP